MWSLTTQLALVAVIVAVATTVALLLRSRRPLYSRFAAFASSIATYYVTALISAVLDGSGAPPADGSRAAAALAAARIIAGSAIIITSTAFFDAILGEAGLESKSRRRKTLLTGIVVAIVGLFPLFGAPAWTLWWIQAAAAAVTMLLLGTRAAAVLRRTRDVESSAERARVRYLAYGGITALLAFGCDLCALAGWPVPPVGGLVVAVYLYFISQALLVRRLLDLHELLGKALVFATLALILAVVYGLLVVWVGDRRGLFLFNTLVASSLILILFEPLKTYLEETTTRVFFREHVTFARGLRALARELAKVIDVNVAVETVLDAIYDAKRATHTSVYFLDPAGRAYALQASRGPSPVASLSAKAHPALFTELQRNPAGLLRDSLQRRLTDGRATKNDLLADGAEATGPARSEALLEALDEVKADLVMPLRAGSDTIGLLCLRDERLGEAYASDEIAALMQVGEQLAINIENSRLFDVLRERDRLATLGEMSAGLAHEIRNPLAAIKGAAQKLDPRRIPEEDRELLEIMVSEVNRLNLVVSEFLDYARPFRGTFSVLSASDAVQRTVQLLRHDIPDTVDIQLELEEGLPDVNADAQQIQQVLINLVLNAADAMDRDGKMWIATRLVKDAHDPALSMEHDGRDLVEIRVRDSGPGIPPRVRENLFIPFFTTKSDGTGLGLPLCQRIIQHHGGTIEVRSTDGKGATFIIRLPTVPKRRTRPPEEPPVEATGRPTLAAPPPETKPAIAALRSGLDPDEQVA